jgi:hypothetical protein
MRRASPEGRQEDVWNDEFDGKELTVRSGAPFNFWGKRFDAFTTRAWISTAQPLGLHLLKNDGKYVSRSPTVSLTYDIPKDTNGSGLRRHEKPKFPQVRLLRDPLPPSKCDAGIRPSAPGAGIGPTPTRSGRSRMRHHGELPQVQEGKKIGGNNLVAARKELQGIRTFPVEPCRDARRLALLRRRLEPLRLRLLRRRTGGRTRSP